jgi:hypothetical protein
MLLLKLKINAWTFGIKPTCLTPKLLQRHPLDPPLPVHGGGSIDIHALRPPADSQEIISQVFLSVDALRLRDSRRL